MPHATLEVQGCLHPAKLLVVVGAVDACGAVDPNQAARPRDCQYGYAIGGWPVDVLVLFGPPWPGLGVMLHVSYAS